MAQIPEEALDLLSDDVPALLYLATIMHDGTPQLTPVWFNYDGEYIYVNAGEGRLKVRNMRERPNVACLIMDPEDDFRYIQIRGRVLSDTTEGGHEHGRDLTEKYLGHRERYYNEPRVIFKIATDKVQYVG